MGRPRAFLILEDGSARSPEGIGVELTPVQGWAPFDSYSRKYAAREVWALRLGDQTVEFGRGRAALVRPAVVIPASEVARRHCRIMPGDESYFVQDLHSTGGIALNDTRVANRGEAIALRSGDYFFIGGYTDRRLVYLDERGARPAWAAPLFAAPAVEG